MGTVSAFVGPDADRDSRNRRRGRRIWSDRLPSRMETDCYMSRTGRRARKLLLASARQVRRLPFLLRNALHASNDIRRVMVDATRIDPLS